MKIQIKSRFSGAVLFEHEAENNTITITVEAAVEARANLDGANLARANLAGANLAGANLDGAYLDGANLDGAYLDGANLAGAYLEDKSVLEGERPVFQIGPIGSRCAYFVAYITDRGLRLRAGCFFGDVKSFKKKLDRSHGDGIHADEYGAALALIEKHAELWASKVDEAVAEGEKA